MIPFIKPQNQVDRFININDDVLLGHGHREVDVFKIHKSFVNPVTDGVKVNHFHQTPFFSSKLQKGNYRTGI